ncbi:MAG TPA: DUF1800 domain-containing protein [Caulobacteraceae bacterium]|nr:DUF1800 domain-containing protein [Caulobacteraceae bacterium]
MRRPSLKPALAFLAAALAAGAGAQAQGISAHDLAVVNRVTWGADDAAVRQVQRMGLSAWLQQQLHPRPGDALAPTVQAQIAALPISQESDAQLVAQDRARRLALKDFADPDAKRQAAQAANQAVNDLLSQTSTRSLLRDLYSGNQLQEQMTWFWLNHFNVFRYKNNMGLYLPAYEETIRAHALGRFRDLLGATARSPAMLRYLDNDQNAAGHVNENYAREIMELHTLGVGSGYSQADVQQLARILTGVGVNLSGIPPKVKPALQAQYVREGLFEFNPNRHDYGDKVLLGHKIQGAGLKEADQALDLLARSPATARHISRELAVYFVADDPPPALVDRMTATFLHTNGDISKVLETMFRSPEFTASLGRKFKDPMHYAVSAVRAAYGDRVIVNTQPLQGWLGRMGEPLYGHETPDGYAMTRSAWSGPGALAVRFEIARQIGSGARGLYVPPAAPSPPGASPPATKVSAPAPPTQAPRADLALYRSAAAPALGAPTRQALGAAVSPQDWATLYLASPEFMYR